MLTNDLIAVVLFGGDFYYFFLLCTRVFCHQEKLLIQGLQYDQYCCQDIPHRLCQQVNDFLLLGDHWDLSTIATCSSKVNSYSKREWFTVCLQVSSKMLCGIMCKADNFLLASFICLFCSATSVKINCRFYVLTMYYWWNLLPICFSVSEVICSVWITTA